MKSGNIGKVSNLGRAITGTKAWQWQSKNIQSRYQSFLVLSNFTEFFHFVSNILSGIVDSSIQSILKHLLE